MNETSNLRGFKIWTFKLFGFWPQRKNMNYRVTDKCKDFLKNILNLVYFLTWHIWNTKHREIKKSFSISAPIMNQKKKQSNCATDKGLRLLRTLLKKPH